MEKSDGAPQRISIGDRLLLHDLPIWIRVFSFVNLGFFALLIGVSIFSPKSLNVADATFVSLYTVVFLMLFGKYGNRRKELTLEEVSKL
jgi:hypothetical protein